MIDEWIVLAPRRGKRPEESANRVTLAWRSSARAGAPNRTMTGYINVSKAVMDKLGWDRTGKVEVAHDPAGTKLRVRLAATGYRIGVTNGCGSFQTWLPWVAGGAHKAEAVAFDLADGALLITLPAWARKPAPPAPEPAKVAAPVTPRQRGGNAAPKPSDAAPPTARDELEAKMALRKGVNARQVAEEFTLGLNLVTRWADEVKAEKGRTAA